VKKLIRAEARWPGKSRSNGNLVVANYIDDYCGGVGFYVEENDDIPVAWLHDVIGPVYINVFERNKTKVAIVEAKCCIKLDSLLK